MKEIHSAGIVVYYITSDGKPDYLILHYIAGHWDFPKGKLEKGETKLAAALRELKEETGLCNVHIKNGFEESFSYIFAEDGGSQVHKTVYFFLAEAKERDIILSDEHAHFVWLSYEKAYSKLTHIHAKKLLKNANTFLEKVIYKWKD